MDATYLDAWLDSKKQLRLLSIREKRRSRFRYYRQTGPKGQFAVVTLSGQPAEDFAFESLANWPCPNDDYSIAVLEGILDELFATDLGYAVAKAHFKLE